MTQTSSVRISVADLRRGDIVVGEAGERLYTVLDVQVTDTHVRVHPAPSDVDGGTLRRVDFRHDATVLVSLGDGRAQAEVQTTAGVAARIPAGIALVNAYSPEPGVVRLVLLNEHHARRAATVLLRGGFEVSRSRHTVTAVAASDG